MKYYSPTTNSFYDSALYAAYKSAGTWPADAVEISDALHAKYMVPPPRGKMLGAGPNSKPSWVKSPSKSLDEEKADKVTELTAACSAEIVGGYVSNALGTSHTYPSKPTDQANMTASVVSSLLPGLSSNWETMFWCADSNGNWAFVSHTTSQIQQAGSDGKAFIQTQQAKLEGLKQQVSAATAVADVQAITW